MPKPLNPEKRAAIADTIRETAGTRSTGSIAKEHGVSRTTVHRIAKEAGLEDAWERSQTEKATRARVVDLAAGRAALQERWLLKANEALDRSEAPCVVYSFGGQFNEYAEHTLDKPPAGEYRSFVTAAAVATDKLVALAKFDAGDDGLASAVSTIDRIMDVVRGAHPDGDTSVDGEP